MDEAYLVCARRNTEAAFRHFFGSSRPGVRQTVRWALRHRVTTAVILLMNAFGLLTYLLLNAA
jgi:multidrug efflux pump subunit AcrB